jgi:putative transcriptional regulator
MAVRGISLDVNSLQGQLLVSSPALVDPNFRKTVILIAHHDEEGALGLVLSRPSEIAAVEAVPSLEGLPGAAGPVFVGGPVQPDAFMVLADFEDVDDAAAPIFGSVGFMPAEAQPDDLDIRRFRLFCGYAGWGAGQLEAELEEPSWIVVPAEPDDAFADDPDELWREVLHRKGGPFELMIDMPFDPGLN